MQTDEIMASDPIITDASTSTSTDGSIEIEFTGGTGNLTIEYTDANGISIGLTDFENLQSGSYGARVTDENGCFKFFSPFFVDFTSSAVEETAIKANIYPNPAQSFFIIESDTELAADPMIYNVNGKLIDSDFESHTNKYRIDTNHLASGVYYIKLVSHSDIILKKILITK